MRLFILLFFVVGCNSIAQLLLKAAALDMDQLTGWGLVSLSFIALGISFLCWFVALPLKPLSFLHPFAALTYIIVPGLASWIFGEKITYLYVIGIIFIVAGICITSGSVCPSGSDKGFHKC